MICLIIGRFLLCGSKFSFDLLSELFLLKHSSALLWLLWICIAKRHCWSVAWCVGCIRRQSIVGTKTWRGLIVFGRWAEVKSTSVVALLTCATWTIWEAVAFGLLWFNRLRSWPFMNKLIQKGRAFLLYFVIHRFISGLFHRIVLVKDTLILESSRGLVRDDHWLGYKTFVPLTDTQLIVIGSVEGHSVVIVWNSVRWSITWAWSAPITGRSQIIIAAVIRGWIVGWRFEIMFVSFSAIFFVEVRALHFFVNHLQLLFDSHNLSFPFLFRSQSFSRVRLLLLRFPGLCLEIMAVEGLLMCVIVV